jgi:hypothetical protein
MRFRIDIGENSKRIMEDMIQRGFFKDYQALIVAALNTLQIKLANDTYTNEYDDDQKCMEEILLHYPFR